MLTTKQLITQLQEFHPDLPVVIRLERYTAQTLPVRESLNASGPVHVPWHGDRVLLESLDVVDTWDGETGTVTTEITVRVLANVAELGSQHAHPSLRLLSYGDVATSVP